jgi:hypothetical protein
VNVGTIFQYQIINWAIQLLSAPPLLRNLGISRGGGGLTVEFPGKEAFRIWNSKGRSNSHMEFPEGEVNFVGWKFHGRTYVSRKVPGVNVP